MEKNVLGVKILVLLMAFTTLFIVSSQAYDLEQYYPLGTGDSRTYLVSGGDQDYEEVRIVEGEETVENYETVKIRYPHFKNGYEYVISGYEGIKICKESVEETYTIFDPPKLLFPNIENVGESKDFTTNSTTYNLNGDKMEEVEESFKFRLESVEDIEVPAGKFENCLKFSSVSSWKDQDEARGGADCSIWLAPEVGMVKSFCVNTRTNPENQQEDVLLQTHELKSAVVAGMNIGSQ